MHIFYTKPWHGTCKRNIREIVCKIQTFGFKQIWRCNWIYEPLLILVIEQCDLCICSTAEWHTAYMCDLHVFRTDSNYSVFLHRRPCFDNTKDMKLSLPCYVITTDKFHVFWEAPNRWDRFYIGNYLDILDETTTRQQLDNVMQVYTIYTFPVSNVAKEVCSYHHLSVICPVNYLVNIAMVSSSWIELLSFLFWQIWAEIGLIIDTITAFKYNEMVNFAL